MLPLCRIAAAVSGLAGDQRYDALDSRRGMDYHRLRPQSVPHASPKGGVSREGDGFVTIDLPVPVLDPEADADRVYQLLIEAMEAVRQAMVAIRNDLAKAVRAAGLWYHEPPPRPAAARSQEGELTKSAAMVVQLIAVQAGTRGMLQTAGSSPMSLLSLMTCSPALRARVDWPVS